MYLTNDDIERYSRNIILPEIGSRGQNKLLESNVLVIGVGGLILAKVPEETAKSRNDYFAQQAQTAIDGVDQNLMRESDPRMPLNKSDIKRSSKVEFGSRNNSNES